MSLATTILFEDSDQVEQYLEANPEVNINDIDEYGFTPLIEAAIANKNDTAKLLVAKGAMVNASDTTNNTALFWAVDNGNLALTKFLLENKADPSAYNRSGQSVLVYPLLRGQTSLKKILYQYKASLAFAQDFILAKLIGHRFGLTGRVHIVNSQNQFILVDLEGFILECTVSIILNSLRKFKNNFAARSFRSEFAKVDQIIHAFVVATQLLKYQKHTVDLNSVDKELNQLFSSELLLLPIAYRGHAVTFVRYGNLLAKCDRGEHGKREGTAIIYRMEKPNNFNPKFLKDFLYKRQGEEAVHHGINEWLGLVPITQLPLQPQITGNCSWANVEGAIPIMFFLLSLQQKNAPTEIINYKTRALTFYQRWLEWEKDTALAECIQNFHEGNKARKAAKAALLAAVLFQCCDHNNVKDLERAEKILTILTIPEFEYVLKSYLKVYWKKGKTLPGNNLMHLLEYCDVNL